MSQPHPGFLIQLKKLEEELYGNFSGKELPPVKVVKLDLNADAKEPVLKDQPTDQQVPDTKHNSPSK